MPLCLCAFFLLPPPLHAQVYDAKIIAKTSSATTAGESITNINPETSLNDSGTAAFVATLSAGSTVASAVLVGDGTGAPVKISFPSLSTTRVYAFPQINNANQVVARDRVSGVPPQFLIRTWSAISPGSMTIIASTTDGVLESATLPTIANDGGIGFIGIPAGSTQTKLYLNTSGDRNEEAAIATLTGGGFRPMAADGGRVVVRAGGSDTDPITLFGASPATIASSAAFSKLGRAPGISDLGSAVAFYGENGDGPGIFISVNAGSGWVTARVARVGAGGNGVLDPGEVWRDINSNGNVDAGEDTGFLAFDSQNRVGVEYLDDNFLVVYVATGSNGKTGIFATPVDVSQSAPLPFPSMLVVEQGQTIEGLAGSADGFSLNDPVNTEGQIVAWVSTGSTQAVVRFDPRPPSPDLIVEFPPDALDFPNGFDPGASGVVIVDVTNRGGADVVSSPAIKIFLSEKEGAPVPPQYPELDTVDIIHSALPLRPNRTIAKYIPLNIPAGLEPGRYQFIARVDTTDVIDEEHEDNNEAHSPRFPVLLPDLTGWISANDFPNGLIPGNSGNLTATILNDSNVVATGSHLRLTFYLSKDLKFDSGVDHLLDHCIIGSPFSLSPQGTIDCQVQNVVIPPNITPCEVYWFLADIDVDQKVDEAKEDNNTTVGSALRIKSNPNAPNPPVIDGVTAKQQDSGIDTAVVVTFRYADPQARELTLRLSASADDGATWNTVPVNTTSVSGDLTVQATPNGQTGTLTWKAGIDWPDKFSESMKVRITDECFGKEGTSGRFRLDTRRKFEVREIKSKFSTSKGGTQPVIFLHEVPFDVQFTVDVDWDGRPPNEIRFKTPKREFTKPHTNHSVSFNMGSDFGPGGRLSVIAIDANNFESDAKDANIEVAPQDPIISFLQEKLPTSSILQFNSGFAYKYDLKGSFPIVEDKTVTIPEWFPFFKSLRYGPRISLNFGLVATSKGALDYSVAGGKSSRVIGGTATQHGTFARILFSGLEISGQLGGTIGWQYFPDQRDEWEFNKGSVTVAFVATQEFPPPSIPPPRIPFTLGLVYVKGEISAGLDTEFALLGFANGQWDFNGIFKPNLGGKLIPGVGFPKVLAVEGSVGVKGAMEIDLNKIPLAPKYALAISGSVRLIALSFATAEQTLFEYKWPDSARSLPVVEIPDAGDLAWQLLPRNYLSITLQSGEETDPGATPAAREARSISEQNEFTIAANVFPYSQPQLIAIGTHTLLLWIGDDPTRSNVNRTSLTARLLENDAWSADAAVDPDGTADFSPVAAATTTGFIAAWEDVKQVLPDGAGLPDMLAALEISASHLDLDTGIWSAPDQLTNNAVLDRSPEIAAANDTALLVWIRNTANDLLGSPAKPNSLMFSAYSTGAGWSTPAVIATGISTVLKTSLLFDGQSGIFIFAADTDGDLATDHDQELFRLNYVATNGWSEIIQLTDNELLDANPQTLFDLDGNPAIFWYQDGTFMMSRQPDLSDQTPLITIPPELSSIDFKATISEFGQMALTWASASKSGSDLYSAVFDNDQRRWSAPIQLTDDVHLERSVTTAYQADGTLITVFNKVPMNLVTRTVLVDGEPLDIEVPEADTDHISLRSIVRVIAGDVTVTNVEFAPENPEPGTDAVISVTVKNAGDLAARGIQVGFFDGDPANGGVRIGEMRTLSGVLGAGSSVVTSTTWRVPVDTTTGHNIHIVVDPQNRYNERNEANNTVAAAVLTADLVLEHHSIETLSPTSYLVQAAIANRGVIPANGAVVNLRKNDDGGLVLAQESISLAVNAETTVSFFVDIEDNPSGEFVAFVAVDPDNLIVESDETNNTDISTAVRVQAPEPSISPSSGVYNQPQNVVLDCPLDDCDVRYTLDGSAPTESSTLFAGPITVNSFTTVTARAFMSGRAPSSAARTQYVFGTENRPPGIDFVGVELIESEELSINLLADASDIDNGPNPLSYTWSMTNPGDGVTFGAQNGTTTGRKVRATFAHNGTYTLFLAVTDGSRSVSSNINVTLPLDRDLDGMPDAWEMRFWDNLAHDDAEDFDGDGRTNLKEYQDGTNPTLLAPATPTPIEPANGSLTSLSPTLTASAFGGPGQTRHAASQWQIAASANFSSIVWDSGEATPSDTVRVPAGVLSEGTRYHWRVRYKNDSGESGNEWSAWSNSALPAWSFRTVTAFPFADDFSGDKGWSGFIPGSWERRAATAGGGVNGSPDPGADFSPGDNNNILGFAIGGDYPVDMGVLEIVSPPIDCSGQSVVELRFQRWLGVDTDEWARASIEVTNDGGETWRQVWENGATAIADDAWTEVLYDLSATAANQPTVQVKFTMGPMSLALPYCGWNIDDVEIRAGAGRLAEVTLETNTATVKVGDNFDVRIYVRENSSAALGFRGGPLDIQFPAALVGYNGSFSSATVIQAPYNAIRTSGALASGSINELGGVTTLNGFGDGVNVLYAVLRFRALAAGTAQIAAAAGDFGFSLTPPVGPIDTRRVFYGTALSVQIEPVVALPIIQVFLEGPRDPVPKNTTFEIKVFAQENSSTATGFLGGPIDLFFDAAKVTYSGTFDPNNVIQAPFKSLGIVSGTLQPNWIDELGGITVTGGSGNGTPVLYAKLTFLAVTEGTATFHATAGQSGLALTSPVGLVDSQQISYGPPLAVNISANPAAVLTSVPPPLTNSRNAQFVVGGSTITHYRFKVDGGAYSAEIAVATPISLTNLTEGQHTLAVVGRSSLGFVQPESSPTTYMWTVDVTPPSAPTAAADSPTPNRRPTWSWTPGAGGIGAFRYQLNSETGSWTETAARAFTPATNLAPDGLYRLYVQERDQAGNWSLSGSAAVLIDTAGPTPGSVRDGLGSDVDTQASLNEIAANWSGFADPGAGIDRYQWAIGHAPGGVDVQNWTDIGNVTSITNASLALTDGTTYYVSVRAVDRVENVGVVASSDGVIVKLEVTFKFAAAGYATSENASTVSIEIVRSGGSPRAADVDYATSDGTAAAGTHYTPAAGTLHFAAGQASAVFTVAIMNNGFADGDRIVNLRLTNSESDDVLDTATLTLIDDDSAAPSQLVFPHRLLMRSAPGADLDVDVFYATSNNDNTLLGLILRVHFDSRRLTFRGLANLLTRSLLEQPRELADTDNLDGDSSTDRYINLPWLDFTGNWPTGPLPARLAAIQFTLTGGWAEGTKSFVRFSTAFNVPSYSFASRPVKIEFRTVIGGIDVDGNGVADALADGLLILRYLAELRGENLIAQAVAGDCVLCDVADIAALLESAQGDGRLDIDGDGSSDAATDGMLVLRYLFGFRDEALTAQLNMDGCSRCTNATIEDYLESLDLQ